MTQIWTSEILQSELENQKSHKSFPNASFWSCDFIIRVSVADLNWYICCKGEFYPETQINWVKIKSFFNLIIVFLIERRTNSLHTLWPEIHGLWILKFINNSLSALSANIREFVSSRHSRCERMDGCRRFLCSIQMSILLWCDSTTSIGCVRQEAETYSQIGGMREAFLDPMIEILQPNLISRKWLAQLFASFIFYRTDTPMKIDNFTSDFLELV
jgi:hypothetical protein